MQEKSSSHLIISSLILMIVAFLTACGIGGYEEEKIKDYRLFMNSEDSRVQNQFKILIERYNEQVGFMALKYAPSYGEANSFFSLIPNPTKPTLSFISKLIWEKFMPKLLLSY